MFIEKNTISKEDYSSFKDAKLHVVLGMLNHEYDTKIRKSMGGSKNEVKTLTKYPKKINTSQLFPILVS